VCKIEGENGLHVMLAEQERAGRGRDASLEEA
jgi:hypothetical protein